MPRRIPWEQVRFAAAVAALALFCASLSWPAVAGLEHLGSDHAWEGVDRVVALGDVHGSFSEVCRLLQQLNLLDEEMTWSGGATHLVFVGDLLDRGSGERPLLDMVRRLQGEAESAGGRVHVLLGNHETMNLVADFRYVSKEGFRAFEDFELPGDRPEAWKAFKRTMRGSALNSEEIEQTFQRRYPPGYFGRARALGPGGEYAEWLLEQAAIIRIDNTIFVHGGLTESVAALGMNEINREVFHDLRQYQEQWTRLEDARAVHRFASFQEVMNHADAVQSTSSDRKLEARIAARKLRTFLDSLVVLPDGPMWYRGTSLEDERIEGDRLKQCLEVLGGETLVVGHTITRSGSIQTRFDGMLYRADVGLAHGGRPQALIFESGEARVFDGSTETWIAAVAEPPNGEGERQAYPQVSDLFMERFLAKASVESVRPLGQGGTKPLLLELNRKDLSARALFKNVGRSVEVKAADGSDVVLDDRYQNEIAAYKLDRFLGLHKVPVTVARTLKEAGDGSVQRWIEGAVDHASFDPEGLSADDRRVLDGRLARGRVFDALIGNPERKESDILHLPERGQLFFVDHSRAFSTSHQLEPFLGAGGCFLDPEMERALRTLSREEIDFELGPWIGKQRASALLARRDGLLKRCDKPSRARQVR